MIKREIYSEIQPFIERDEIILLNGARQVGKTTLLQMIQKDLQKKDMQTFFYNAEHPADAALLNDYNACINTLQSHRVKNKKLYLFIDEIQTLAEPSHLLKLLYDEHHSWLKIFASGSAQLDIKAKLQDSLVGRKITFWLHPFSLTEYLRAVNVRTEHNPIRVEEETQRLIDEYMLYGGLPAVVLADSADVKKRLLQEYVATYINKDIRQLIADDHITSFNQLMKGVAGSIGGLKRVSELARELGINRLTADRYMTLLRYSFVITLIPAFTTKTIKRLVKQEKIYLFDTGVRNALLGDFRFMSERSDAGAVFENIICQELQRVYPEQLWHLRNQSGNEIDFIFQNDTGQYRGVEVKYSALKQPHLSRGLWEIAHRLPDIQMTIVNTGLKERVNPQIEYLPIWEWIKTL